MAQDSPRKRRERRLRRTLSQTRRLFTKSLEHRQRLAAQVNQLINHINANHAKFTPTDTQELVKGLNQIASNTALDAPGATISAETGQGST